MNSSTDVRSWEEQHPRLGDGVGIDPPIGDGAPWIISVAGVPRARVGSDFARMASFLDGRRSLRDAVRLAGLDVDGTQALAALDALASAGLLAAADKARRPRRRFVYRRPLTFQWTLFDPSPLAAVLARPFRSGNGSGAAPVLLATLSLLVLLAGISVVGNAPLILALLSSPLPLDMTGVLLLVVLATGCMHELAHAVALSAVGGRPTRMGLMLLYFFPAFFCDVTDGWRVRERSRRAAVALAGPALHLAVGCLALALVVVVADEGVRRFLVVFGVACLLAVAANLVPFLKLDGYLALVAATDTPHLRARAIERAGRLVARFAFGVRAYRAEGSERHADEREPFGASWALGLFGALCAVFPAALFLWVAVRLQPVLVALGPWSAGFFLLLVLAFVASVLRTVGRFFVAVFRGRPRPGRTAVTLSLVALCTAGVLSVPVQTSVHAGFVVLDGQVLVVAASAEGFGAGDRVVLRKNGVALRPEVGRGVIAQGSAPQEVSVPVDALAPVSSPGVSVAARGVPVVIDGDVGRLPPSGMAEVESRGPEPVGALLLRAVVEEPVAVILSGSGR